MAKKNTETGKQVNPEKSASKTKSDKTTATSKKAADQPKTVSAKTKIEKLKFFEKEIIGTLAE